MALVRFTSGAESAGSQVLEFTENPNFPRSSMTLAPLLIPYRVADGTPYLEQVGHAATVSLTWPQQSPMTRADYAALLTFWSVVRGTQDTFSFRGDDGVTHDANFVEGPHAFTEHTSGFAGTLVLRIR